MANSKMFWLFLFTCASILPLAFGHHERRQSDPPTVDLGYEIHEGYLNSTGEYYVFSNIPYAEQPVGELRFEKPVPIEGSSSRVNNGSAEDGIVICPQAYPQWVVDFLAKLSGIDRNTMAILLNRQPGQTEACLVLDVYVPVDVFKGRGLREASVLVWIHGGGFTFGSKTLYGSPAGLIARSRQNGEDGIIVVSINYRLGLFGWLSGKDITTNLGLYDQRLALEWVKRYIPLFGGDANKVTVMGESAGASSIVHQITAYGGEKPAPFKAAIVQSPGFQFNLNLTANYRKTLFVASQRTRTNIEGVAGLRNLTAAVLSTINQETVATSSTGSFGFGPGPDGSFVPDIPQRLLYEGKFDSSVKLFVSHTTNESVPFLWNNIGDAAAVRVWVHFVLREASDKTIDALLTDERLYPDVLDGSPEYPWTTQFGRATRLTSDILFSCTTRYLVTARESKRGKHDGDGDGDGNGRRKEDGDSFALVFDYPPAWHATDVPYVFFNGGATGPNGGPPVNATLATRLQDYIVAFARTGDPNAEGNAPSPPRFPAYGAEARVLRLGHDGFQQGEDDLKGERCRWIQQALIDGRL